MDKAELLKRVADVRAKGAAVVASRQMTTQFQTPGDYRTARVVSWVNPGAAGLFRAAGVSLLLDLYGANHQHYVDFLAQTSNTYNPIAFEQAGGIIQVVEEQINNGWYETLKGLIAANLFSDFLEMAEHLHSEKYKDAAAVIAGSSLEGHIKRLCIKAGIPTTTVDGNNKVQAKKADTLNADLSKAGVYDKNEQKQVTAWLGVRNDAAHGDYTKVKEDIVGVMIAGIRLFVNRYPA